MSPSIGGLGFGSVNPYHADAQANLYTPGGNLRKVAQHLQMALQSAQNPGQGANEKVWFTFWNYNHSAGATNAAAFGNNLAPSALRAKLPQSGERKAAAYADAIFGTLQLTPPSR